MSPLKLTDDELDQVFRAAQPLAPADRDQLRACHEAQRQFFDPPDLGGPGVWAKYR
jgi:hypothetical protein